MPALAQFGVRARRISIEPAPVKIQVGVGELFELSYGTLSRRDHLEIPAASEDQTSLMLS